MVKAEIFYSYAHEDNKLRIELEKHLSVLFHQGLISSRHDQNIDQTPTWTKKINTHINTADIILLLISPDFMYSKYCSSIEMERSLERHQNGSAKVIPIILRPGYYEGAPFSHLKALPSSNVPIKDPKRRNSDQAFKEVVVELKKVIEITLSEKLVDDGKLKLYNEEYKLALKLFEDAIKFYPDNSEAYCGKGQSHLGLIERSFHDENAKKALEAFEKVLEINPNNVDAMLGKVKAYHFIIPRKNVRESIELCQQAINIDPNNERSYIEIAAIYKDRRDYSKALSYYDQAIELNQNLSWEAFIGKARMLFALDRREEALDVLQNFSITFPNKGEHLEDMGDIYFSIENYYEAIKKYDEAIALKQYKNREVLSEIYRKKSDAFKAREMYQEALNECENSISNHYSNEAAFRLKSELLSILSQKASDRADEILNDIFGDGEDITFEPL